MIVKWWAPPLLIRIQGVGVFLDVKAPDFTIEGTEVCKFLYLFYEIWHVNFKLLELWRHAASL